MNHQQKEQLFNNFLNEWGSKFQKVPSILAYLSKYSVLQKDLEDIPMLNRDELIRSQLEWIALIAQLDNPIETAIFKPYWVPIAKDNYDHFIDVSSNTFSIFRIYFRCVESHRWFIETEIHSTLNFLMSMDDHTFELAAGWIDDGSTRRQFFKSIFIERSQFGITENIGPNPTDRYWWIGDHAEDYYELTNNKLTIRDVSSVVIGLLPSDMKISIRHFQPENLEQSAILKTDNIKSFTYLLQIIGTQRVQSYHVLFESENNCYATYESGVFRLYHNDNSLLSLFVDQFCKTKKEGKHSA